MDEFDAQLHAGAADLRNRAAGVAQTDTALDELHAAAGRAGPRSRWVPRTVVAAAIVAAAIAGIVILRADDNPRSISSSSERSLTPTSVSADALTTATSADTESTVVITTEPTSEATLSTSTPFDECDYTDPGKFPVPVGACPDGTTVESVGSSPAPLIVGEPSPTVPAAILRGVVSIDGPCVYLIDAFGGPPSVIVWPAGTSWDDRRSEIVLPDGQRIDDGAAIDGDGGHYSASNVPDLDPGLIADITACLPPGADEHTADVVVRAFPVSVTPPTVVPLTPTS